MSPAQRRFRRIIRIATRDKRRQIIHDLIRFNRWHGKPTMEMLENLAYAIEIQHTAKETT